MVHLQNNPGRRFCLSFFLLLTVCLLAACNEKSIAETENEAEANLMFDILYSNGLRVEKTAKTGEQAGWSIVINEGWFGEGEAAVATQVLNDHGLPRPKDKILTPTSSYGMESPEEVKKRQNREKEVQIENHLFTLPGVIRTSVIIAQPADEILSLQKTPPTATVSIVQTEIEPKFTTDTVRSMVTGSVPNLKAENINVAVSHQVLREIPLEKLAEKRRSNMIFALGGGLIALLVAALIAVWYAFKRRKRPSEAEEFKQISDEDELAELDINERRALNSAEEETY